MPGRFSSFQRLALWTTATTYLLILVGGLVRASGAGLGCPDWPRCFGGWIPPASAADLPPGFDPAQFNATLMWTEYLNRLLGVTVGLLVLATVVSAFAVRARLWREKPHRLVNDAQVMFSGGSALRRIPSQCFFGGGSSERACQAICEVDRVRHTRVHAMGSERGHEMGGIAS